MIELSPNCPIQGAENPNLTYEWITRGVIPGEEETVLSLSDQNLGSLCNFYRRIGLCPQTATVLEVETE